MNNRHFGFVVILTSLLLLNACGVLEVRLETPTVAQETPVKNVTAVMPPPELTATASAAPAPTRTPTPGIIPVNYGSDIFQSLTAEIDPSLAASTTLENLTAAAETPGGPYWLILPQRVEISLNGYPVEKTQFQPQITVYPVDEFKSINQTAGNVIDSLKALLELKPGEQNLEQASMALPPGQSLPFLPLEDAQQLFHAHFSYIAFKNGGAVCYLTQFDQYYALINNHELIYTCQGLTSDGRFYVAAVLPVNLAFLPADDPMATQVDPGTYTMGVVQQINSAGPASFTPHLDKLDAMLASMTIK